MAAVEFCPQGVDFSTLNERIREGSEKMPDNGVLTVNLGKLQKSDTVAICLLLALMRRARHCRCRVETVNISPGMRKLLNLYQIGKWWPEG